ncbi:DEAD/DEAH box helicase [Planococcus wigleyi]|uniref:DEAD/DEAH box helicase family protein n=1 Tax=Planococcus wigleyi TaxID=2762216 RepID=A0ABR8WDE2_9BACL|nr:DEAD/DEAH box helicase family protein [Planococcus wigleyi]MBD8015046.1 DEAD/DEAH box helicase family protein [Planococcus wigleyi]
MINVLDVRLPKVIETVNIGKNNIFQVKRYYDVEKIKINKELQQLELVDSKIVVHLSTINDTRRIAADFILEINSLEGNKEELVTQIEKGVWKNHPDLESNIDVEKVSESWKEKFSPELLRIPQKGALYSTLSHWTVSNNAATIVMPTGTGKTETMLSIMLSSQISRLIVIVPSDALRIQLSDKFISLGVLSELNMISNIDYPKVGILKEGIKDKVDFDSFLKNSNVIVTTMDMLTDLPEQRVKMISGIVDYLFIDEAHHIAAKTWRDFKKQFYDKRILQFTATPFRNDGKHIEGSIIYNYPLKKAQEEGYFKMIDFLPVQEFDEIKADQAIANQAIKKLKEDIKADFNHILMVRVSSKKRAKEIYELYKNFKQFNPVVIYSGIPKKELEASLEALKEGKSRIVVCVNMLGEGYDLPQLKIAAMHDKHKSLGITLQFIGRFTRTGKGKLGNASLIANIANEEVNKEIESLYQRDSEWNSLIQRMSTETIEERVQLDQFAGAFHGNTITGMSIQEFRPKTSTVIYESKNNKWFPKTLEEKLANIENTWVLFNELDNILIVVEKRKGRIPWSNNREIYDLTWEASIFYWNTDLKLLFVNSSANEWLDKWVKILLPTYQKVQDELPYKSFYGVSRLQLNTVGLNEAIKGPLRYRMYTGLDIGDALSAAERRTSVKSNIFGIGYEDGEVRSIGASYKGKVWAKSSSTIPMWIEWCNKTGYKIRDEKIELADILKGVLRREIAEQLPEEAPISADWPFELFDKKYFTAEFFIDNRLYELSEMTVRFSGKEKKKLLFEIETEESRTVYSMQIKENKVYYALEEGALIEIKEKTSEPLKSFESYLENHDMVFRYLDTSFLEGNTIVKVPLQKHVFDTSKVDVWKWKGVDIKKESQFDHKTKKIRTDSIQYHVIKELKSKVDYSIVFDDDGSGEVADIITIRENNNKLYFEFYHCKYSDAAKPGSRIKDLYEVCGQASKSVDWRSNMTKLISHMKERERKRRKKDERTRFEVGNMEALQLLSKKIQKLDCDLKVYIVQPGIIAEKLTEAQLNVLASTENYLKVTYRIDLAIISS